MKWLYIASAFVFLTSACTSQKYSNRKYQQKNNTDDAYFSPSDVKNTRASEEEEVEKYESPYASYYEDTQDETANPNAAYRSGDYHQYAPGNGNSNAPVSNYYNTTNNYYSPFYSGTGYRPFYSPFYPRTYSSLTFSMWNGNWYAGPGMSYGMGVGYGMPYNNGFGCGYSSFYNPYDPFCNNSSPWLYDPWTNNWVYNPWNNFGYYDPFYNPYYNPYYGYGYNPYYNPYYGSGNVSYGNPSQRRNRGGTFMPAVRTGNPNGGSQIPGGTRMPVNAGNSNNNNVPVNNTPSPARTAPGNTNPGNVTPQPTRRNPSVPANNNPAPVPRYTPPANNNPQDIFAPRNNNPGGGTPGGGGGTPTRRR